MSSSRRVLGFLYRTQNWTRFHRWCLLWSWRRHCFWEKLIFIYCDGVSGWPHVLLPRKEEVVDWLSNIYRVRSVGVVHSHELSHLLHRFHFSKLVHCHGYLHLMLINEIPAHHLYHVPYLDWDVRSCQKNSRDCFSHLNLY